MKGVGRLNMLLLVIGFSVFATAVAKVSITANEQYQFAQVHHKAIKASTVSVTDALKTSNE